MITKIATISNKHVNKIEYNFRFNVTLIIHILSKIDGFDRIC